MSVQKRKRISKKTKSAWRKTDIKDVEEFLEDQRQEERIGSFTEKKDDELFIVDASPLKPKRAVLTEKQKRKLNAQKPLRSLEALNNTSKVQDPIVKRNRVRQKKNGRIIEEEVRNPTKPRHFQANKDRELYYESLEKKLNKEKHQIVKDIWAEEDFRDKLPGLKDEKGWISKELALHVVKNVGKPVIKVHDSIRHRTTKAKKFEPPHPGMSYNPSLDDHQNLLKTVAEREEKIIKEKEHLKRVTTKMFSKVTPEERDRRRIEEMRSGLDEAGEEEETNENEKDGTDGEAYKTVNPPVENKKKSKKSRRKELEQKELKKKHAEKKALKKQIADLNRIKSIKAEVLAEEEKLNALKKHRKKVELKKKFETKRLGRLKFVEPDADVNMPEDIPGNLRNVKPESSLLVDRFMNFQKRNIIPVSVATGKQKAKKVKRFPRSSHKEPGVSFQMLREQRKSAKA